MLGRTLGYQTRKHANKIVKIEGIKNEGTRACWKI